VTPLLTSFPTRRSSDLFRRGRDENRLGLLADLEPDVQTARVVGTEDEIRSFVRLEPGQFNFEFIGGREQAGEEVLSTVISDRRRSEEHTSELQSPYDLV